MLTLVCKTDFLAAESFFFTNFVFLIFFWQHGEEKNNYFLLHLTFKNLWWKGIRYSRAAEAAAAAGRASVIEVDGGNTRHEIERDAA